MNFNDERTEEADKVFSRTAEILSVNMPERLEITITWLLCNQ